jgi:hypothetical protein
VTTPLPRRAVLTTFTELSSARVHLMQDGDAVLLRGNATDGFRVAHTVTITGAVLLTGDVVPLPEPTAPAATTNRVLFNCKQSVFCLLTRCARQAACPPPPLCPPAALAGTDPNLQRLPHGLTAAAPPP